MKLIKEDKEQELAIFSIRSKAVFILGRANATGYIGASLSP